MVPEPFIPTQLIPAGEREKPGQEQLRRSGWNRVWILLQLAVGTLVFTSLSWFTNQNMENRRNLFVTSRLSRLGMLWIRLAQMVLIQTRWLASPLGPLVFNLKASGRVISYSRVRQIIEETLGPKRPFESCFTQFERSPFAASDTSQTHRALLKNEQCWVAVKVQHPDALDLFRMDLGFIRVMIWFCNRLGIFRELRWNDFYQELREIGTQELNYQFEKTALSTLSKQLRGQPMYVPEVFFAYSSSRVLCMEFIQGALLADIADLKQVDPSRLQNWLDVNQIQLNHVAKRFFQAMYRQIFEANFFHNDLNFHNIILLKNNRFALIECRSTGSLDRELLQKKLLYLNYLAKGDFVTAAEIHFLFGKRLPRVNLERVKESLIRIWRRWEMKAFVRTIPYDERSFTTMYGEVNETLTRERFSAVWFLSKLNTSLIGMDLCMAVLDSNFNPIIQMRRYFREAAGRKTVQQVRELPSRITANLDVLHAFPEKMEEFNLLRESLMRRQALVIHGSSNKLVALAEMGISLIRFFCIIGLFYSILGLARPWFPEGVALILGAQLGYGLEWLDNLGSFSLELLAVMFAVTWIYLFLQARHLKSDGRSETNATGWEV